MIAKLVILVEWQNPDNSVLKNTYKGNGKIYRKMYQTKTNKK